MPSKILQCSCNSISQDEIYGKQSRLHNQCKPKETHISYRCTVCGNIKVSQERRENVEKERKRG